MNYQKHNAKTIDQWCLDGWTWGQPITHEVFQQAKEGHWNVYLTPTKVVPHEWFGELKGKKILGLASGGGQQMPVFSALEGICTVLDYSQQQCLREEEVAQREGYQVTVIQGDMTERFPFADESFDLIFQPVSNCYIEDVDHIFQECYRVLKPGGIYLGGFDTGMNFAVDETETQLVQKLPYHPLKDLQLYQKAIQSDDGIQFSHTLEEQIRGQLKVGFVLLDLYEDTNRSGHLMELNIPAFVATRAVKKKS